MRKVIDFKYFKEHKVCKCSPLNWENFLIDVTKRKIKCKSCGGYVNPADAFWVCCNQSLHDDVD